MIKSQLITKASEDLEKEVQEELEKKWGDYTENEKEMAIAENIIEGEEKK